MLMKEAIILHWGMERRSSPVGIVVFFNLQLKVTKYMTFKKHSFGETFGK